MRWTIIAATVAAAAVIPAQSQERAWPSRPVRVVVATAAGSGTDAVVRLIAPRLSERWKQPVTIDNQPGPNGIVAVQALLAATDGHTLLFTPSGQLTLPAASGDSLPYDARRDLIPIAAAVDPTIGIAVGSRLGVGSLAEMVALVRQRTRDYVWAAAPGLPDMLFRAFLELERVPMKRVAFPDPSAAVRDLDAGKVDVVIASLPTLSPSLRAGLSRLIAVTNSRRAAAYPDVPTATEAGYPDLSVDGQWGFFGSRELADSLREEIAVDIRVVLSDPVMVKELSAMGLTPAGGTTQEFTEALDSQRTQISRLLKILGARP